MLIRDAAAADLPGILAIYNDAVVNTTATAGLGGAIAANVPAPPEF